MIRNLLIANRGEIAVRIARTCRRLGIRTVAVYSDADRDALHVASADEARRIGPPEPRVSYLDVGAVIHAARAAGADAIHPGYGFLAERVELAEACGRAGLIFVGPHASAIRTMGSKPAARALAERLGIPVVPGHHEDGRGDETLVEAARRIGYPLMIKASAGGGGKGIRIVESEAGLVAALPMVRREARSAFGDDGVILEWCVPGPRHIEVQIMGDAHGNVFALGDRDCSIQRNHQKLIEEAPAPGLQEALRESLRRDAIRLAREIGYDSAGTVEFIVDARGESYYFLEMNTRLQVEHTVTEAVTGLDLVELQLRSAAGEALDLNPATLRPRGCAIEARVTAEQPEADFRPDTGGIHTYHEPSLEGIRIDSGVRAGSVVTPYYDALVAKVIAWAEDRDSARRRLADALEDLVIGGVATNQDFVRRVILHPAFAAADLRTDFLSRHFEGWRLEPRRTVELATAAALSWVSALEARTAASTPHAGPWERLGPWRILRRAGYEGTTDVTLEDGDGAQHVFQISGVAGEYRVRRACGGSGDQPWLAARAASTSAGRCRIEVDGVTREYIVAIHGSSIFVAERDFRHNFSVRANRLPATAASTGARSVRDLRANVPGVVVEVRVAAGDAVRKGDTLLVMESMKMVLHLQASGDAQVRVVHCTAGATVSARDLLLEFEPAAS